MLPSDRLGGIKHAPQFSLGAAYSLHLSLTSDLVSGFLCPSRPATWFPFGVWVWVGWVCSWETGTRSDTSRTVTCRKQLLAKKLHLCDSRNYSTKCLNFIDLFVDSEFATRIRVHILSNQLKNNLYITLVLQKGRRGGEVEDTTLRSRFSILLRTLPRWVVELLTPHPPFC